MSGPGRILAAVFAALFTVGVVVQGNDPDPLPWMLAYGVGAVLSGLAAAGRVAFLPSVVATLVYGVWLVAIAMGLEAAPLAAFTSFEMKAPDHEEPREALGLLLLAAWSLRLAIAGRAARRSIDSEEGA